MISVKEFVQKGSTNVGTEQTPVMKPVTWFYLELDYVSDLNDLDPNSANYPFSNFVVFIGSEAHIIENNTMYMMQSDGTWVIQEDPMFSGIYTKSQIDDMLSDIDDIQTAQAVSIRDLQFDVEALQQANNATNGRLGKLVDEGAKNILNWSATTSTTQNVTFTINDDDRTVSTSGTANQRAQKPLNFSIPSTLPAGQYVLSGCPAGGAVGATVKYCLYVWDVTTNSRVSLNDTGNGVTFDWIPDSTHQYNISVDIRAGNNADGLVFKPMITESWKYALSQTFVPYSPTNAELAKMILNQ